MLSNCFSFILRCMPKHSFCNFLELYYGIFDFTGKNIVVYIRTLILRLFIHSFSYCFMEESFVFCDYSGRKFTDVVLNLLLCARFRYHWSWTDWAVCRLSGFGGVLNRLLCARFWYLLNLNRQSCVPSASVVKLLELYFNRIWLVFES